MSDTNFPKINRAIPRKRFQVGEYSVTVLGEVESPDIASYQFIMAFVADGKQEPALYITSEKTPPKDRHEGSHRLRVINSAMSEIMDTADHWKDIDTFTPEAMKLGMQILGLSGEQPSQLM